MSIAHRILAGVAGAGLMLLPAAAAHAAPAPTASVSADRLVLEPGSRGYTGTMPVTVRYRGAEPAHLTVRITEPVQGSWKDLELGAPCLYHYTDDGRRIGICHIDGEFQPGETRVLDATFEVLTKTRTFAMSLPAAPITVGVTDVMTGTWTQTDADTYNTRFRSTDGSLANPRPYVRDTESNASVTVGASVTLTRGEDGSFHGRLPVTVTWKGDVAHEYVFLDAKLPSGIWVEGTDPDYGTFASPMMQGETRTFDLLIGAPAETRPGDYGQVVAEVSAYWDGQQIVDRTPADNADTFTLSIVG
ncbi:hypothetical protein [Asanoa iriomotensis]|uniref:Uncharacterized protein n=1 Tax=Asanoa iriomotensis TaxID=234613 RepID=A0ABQ4C754_9ACTN|nr:hypothetical protein [Asanoa iriomotensis]GIF58609.1 hypothetical protein Air01nite_47040 [Asanoa iriomotensis]